MNIQYIIVIAVVLAAVVYAGMIVIKQTHAFSAKKKCEAGCGCDSGSKQRSS